MGILSGGNGWNVLFRLSGYIRRGPIMATRGLITWVLVRVAHDRMRRKRDGEGSAGDSGRTFMHVIEGVTGHSELRGRPGGARAALQYNQTPTPTHNSNFASGCQVPECAIKALSD
jgi:hypothetical protein